MGMDSSTMDRNILLISSDQGLEAQVRGALESFSGESYFLHGVNKYAEAAEAIEENYWDLTLIDFNTPRGKVASRKKLEELQALSGINSKLPILVFNPNSGLSDVDTRLLEDALKAGAHGEIRKPSNSEPLFRSRLNVELKAIRGERDPLTGLLNKAVFSDRVSEEYEKLTRALAYSGDDRRGSPGNLSVVFIDVDRLKSFNSEYGHMKTDRMLRHVADGLRKPGFLRQPEVAARFGGDEYAMMFSGSLTHENVVEKIRPVLKEITHDDISKKLLEADSPVYVGLSVGVATYPSPNQASSYEGLAEMANKAMYAAKKSREERDAKGKGFTIFGFTPTGTLREYASE